MNIALSCTSATVEYNPNFLHSAEKPCVRSFSVKESYRPVEYRYGGKPKTWFCPDHPKLPLDKSLQELTEY